MSRTFSALAACLHLLASPIVYAVEANIEGMDRAAIRAVIRGHLKDIRACYESGLKQNAELNGKVIVDWHLNENGVPEKVNIIQGIATSVDECVARVVAKMQFENPPKGQQAHIRYPFVFSKSE